MFGSRIAALRRSMGLTQASLARQLNVSNSTLGMYEQGRREPPLDLVVTLSEIFNVSTDYLLTGCTSLSEDSNTLYELLSTLQEKPSKTTYIHKRSFLS